jgi:peroxiredoxin
MLTWRGEIASAEGEPGGAKKFEMVVVVASAGGAETMLWTLGEEGLPKLSWAHRFGRYSGRAADGDHPRLLVRHETGASIVSAPPVMTSAPSALSAGLSWNESEADFTVEGEEQKQGRPAWRVAGRSRFGVAQTRWVDKETGLLLACHQSLVLGQGERYTLTCELAESSQLNDKDLAAAAAQFDAWLALKGKLELKSAEPETIWSADQIALLAKELPPLAESAGSTPLAQVAKDAAEDARDQKNQSGAVGALAKKVLGAEAPKFEFKTLEGGKLASADLGGAVTVLHFWTYRDAPLEEPYGQVGYIDYLHRRRKEQGVKVFGVAVDERFDDPETRRAAMASVKRLQAFMNLDYPLLIDGGDQIEKFGDPRAAGAKLPLVIVIGADGKVIHYRAGLYDVDRDRGLHELDAVIGEAGK